MFKKLIFISLILIVSYFIISEKQNTKNNIIIGSSLAYNGSLKSWGETVYNTVNAYFKYTNENNLIQNKHIEFLALDDKYEPNLTFDNIKSILNNDILSFFGIVGTPTIRRVMPIFEDNQTPFFSPFSGASFLRDKDFDNIINFRASYKQEIENIIDYITNTKKLSKISIFYQNDEYGEDGYISTLQALESKNLKLISAGTYKRNTLSINHAFNEIKNSKPEVILLVGAYKANALFIKKAKKDEFLKDVIFCNISFSDANSIIKELKNSNVDSSNIIFSNVVPNYDDKNLKIVQEYQEVMQKYAVNKELGFISFEAFLASKVLIDAIIRLEGNYSSRELIYALKNPPKDILSEIKLEFENHQLLNTTYLFEYKDDKFQEILR
ncbi:ABC transporter substrate-binding protein [Aliarcobacter vitoriensis]|uniref:Amino acid-binding protein n=1 Tax=Aliarcobacter vitoriensis TaxID=2011099 RepID=A0A366MNV6_9BACT|nr:ABC transporter substrate-binding protein [Aliarcobacter vitoriensis]RBQ27956.1 amino acid-binding protein [Aliarcobacter vitoriensis]RBQ30372.1 amino acid-binding protein [Arcobacter sp. FW59]